MSSGAPRLPHSLGPKTCLGHAIVLVGKVGLEARRLSVEGLPPLYRSAEISTMIPLNGSDTNGSLLLAAEHYGDYESGMGGASRTLVVLRTRGDRTTEGRVGNSMVKAQRGALLMAIAPVRDCAYSSLDVHSQASPPRKRPFPRPHVKKRRAQPRITFHKSHFFASKSHTYPPVPLQQPIKAKCFRSTLLLTPPSHVARIKRLLGLKSRAITSKLPCHSMGVHPVPLL